MLEVIGPAVLIEVERRRGHDAELVPFGIDHDEKPSALVAVDSPTAERLDPMLRRDEIGRGEVEVDAVLARSRLHHLLEAHAGGTFRVLQPHIRTLFPSTGRPRSSAQNDARRSGSEQSMMMSAISNSGSAIATFFQHVANPTI